MLIDIWWQEGKQKDRTEEEKGMENMEQRKEGAKGERKGGEGREKSLLHNFNVQAAAHGYALASHSPLTCYAAPCILLPLWGAIRPNCSFYHLLHI